MLNTFLVYLWKEWRDNRAIVIGIGIAVPAIVGLCRWAIPESVFEHHIFPPVTALAFYAIALLSLGSDLIPGEMRRDTLDFLRRLPADLKTPFLAKAVFLGLVLTAVTWYAYGVACWFGKVPDQARPELAQTARWAYWMAPWVFAVSCWLPRGALAVPGAALALALLGLPIVLMTVGPDTPSLAPSHVDQLTVAVGLWSVVVAWVSWVRGYRFGRGIYSAVWRGMAAALVLFVPAWAYAGLEVRAWRTIDPHSDRFTILSALLSPDGRSAYASVRMAWADDRIGPVCALRVDLESGAWRRIGGLHEPVVAALQLRSMGEPVHFGRDLSRKKIIAVVDRTSSHRPKKSAFNHQAWLTYYDADSGERITAGWQSMDHPELIAAFGDAWIDLPKGYTASGRRGLGWYVGNARHRKLFDVARGRLYPLRFKDYRNPYARPGRWLAWAQKRGGGMHLVDPETGEGEPARGIPAHKHPAHVELLADGRLLYAVHHLHVVDPETGQSHKLADDVSHSWVPGAMPNGDPVVSVYFVAKDHRSIDQRVARLIMAENRLEYAGPSEPGRYNPYVPVATLDDESVLCLHNHRRLVRLRFGSEVVEPVWPR